MQELHIPLSQNHPPQDCSAGLYCHSHLCLPVPGPFGLRQTDGQTDNMSACTHTYISARHVSH